MSDKIINILSLEPELKTCAQFDYRGFVISMSTAFKKNPEIAAWSKDNSEEGLFATVQEAIEWADKILY